ncbi:Rpn family recombination-promoting nuclease/putative transposase [Candidatus Stoquefichus massiliensis]|uniref:Rpn family recombination-promoting nuclease/putative transposase n=1 Tax=Candidatus Stoquefichus massiliensis TaxID=1470350 RepID=UPI000484141A|nr:Rpn family recombination-promoting nuclease/putative transposase [Candidatus Stoquefichus massiliensis]
MLTVVDGISVLIAIEHQQRIDDSMCKRVLTYDHATYNQQFNLCDVNKRQCLHFIPVVTIVIYTGESYWIKPITIIKLKPKAFIKISNISSPQLHILTEMEKKTFYF